MAIRLAVTGASKTTMGLVRGFSALSHVDGSSGRPQMVDVSEKFTTIRTAVAKGNVYLSRELMEALGKTDFNESEVMSKKGPVFATAVIAGTQAVKKTSELIPFCHSINVDSCKFDVALAASKDLKYPFVVDISCTVKCEGKTGIEMEALVGASTAALCVYDMLKGLSHDMVISEIKLVNKTGGKSDVNVSSSK